MSDGDSDKLVGTGEAARLLGMSPDTVCRYFDAGRLDGEVLESGYRRVSLASVNAMLAAREERRRRRLAARTVSQSHDASPGPGRDAHDTGSGERHA